ncbi:MAG TPA: GNAT family N-acetyltransferase [Streptosporangiaceae bacterium]
MRLRRIRPDEGELLRRLRLGALADVPSAFDSTLTRERELPAAEWHRRARAGAEGDSAVTFVVEDGTEVVGLVTGLWDGDGEHGAQVVSMWVDRRARGRGIGRLLLDAVVDWAVRRGAPRAELWVTDGNDPARRLYEQAGFVPTGVRAPLDSNPALTGIELVLPRIGERPPPGCPGIRTG